MGKILQDLSAPGLVTAYEANLFEFFSLLRQWRRVEIYIGPDMLWTLTDIPASFFNSIIRAQLSPDEVDEAIEAAINRGKSKNVPIEWWTGPATRPANLGLSLQAHGFVHKGEAPGMAIDLTVLNEDTAMPSRLEIEQVAEIDTLRKWRQAFTTGFGMPDFMGDAFFETFSELGFDAGLPFRNYIGFLNGEPVATSSLVLGGGVAGIYSVATVPEARQKGIGTALTFRALREAHVLGYKVGVLESSKMGASVYQKMGFQEYWKMSHYVWTSERANPGAS